MAEQKFPSEVIDLPSEGKLYPEGHPLKDGKIEIKYMTAKVEDILTSQNLIKKGVVIDRLLDSLILTNGAAVPPAPANFVAGIIPSASIFFDTIKPSKVVSPTNFELPFTSS